MLLKPKQPIFIDSHIHSKYSFDGHDDIINICNAAYQNNLSAITITDHCDINFNSNINMLSPLKLSNTDCIKAKSLFKNKLSVYCGIELGQPLENVTLATDILNSLKLDFTLLSLHNMPYKPDFYFYDNFTKENVSKMLYEYFDQLINTIKCFNSFDSLAHLTYPLRYVYLKSNIKPDINLFIDKIDYILNLLIEKNKALELNVSGFAKGINTSLPGKNIIKRFKYLGGKYITLGSDSHNAYCVGNYIDKGINIIKSCGFSYITIFNNHKPNLIHI